MRKIIAVMLLVLLHSSSFSQPTWKRIESLKTARYNFGAHYIGNNEILVLGGFNSGGFAVSSCEIINIQTNKVSAVTSMTEPRAEFVSLLTKDSNVIAIGGINGGTTDICQLTNSVELFDRKTKTWRVIGELLIPRRQHGAAFLNDSIIIVAGSMDAEKNCTNKCELFNIRTGISDTANNYPMNVNSTILEKSSDNTVLALGGREGGENSDRTKKLFGYNEKLNKWDSLSLTVEAANVPSVTKLWDGRILIVGGSRKENPYNFSKVISLETSANTFSKFGETRDAKHWNQSNQWTGDSILAIGGYNNTAARTSLCDWINLKLGTVSTGPNLIEGRAMFKAVSVPYNMKNGRQIQSKIYVIGGRVSNSITNGIELLEPSYLDGGEPAVDPCELTKKRVDLNSVLKVGSARKAVNDSSITLTRSKDFEAGAFWVPQKQFLSDGFATTFQFRMSEGIDNSIPDGSEPGADGLAFVIQNDTTMHNLKAAESIGYVGIKNSLAVEFDTYKNESQNDGNGNHVAIQSNGVEPNSANHNPQTTKAMSSSMFEIKNNRDYWVKVTYDNKLQKLSVYMSENEFFSSPVAVANGIDLSKLLRLDSGRAWVGFTGATGSAWSKQEIKQWFFTPCSNLATDIEFKSNPDQNEQLLLFPNPTIDKIIVETDLLASELPTTIRVVDVLGIEVFYSHSQFQTSSIEINTSALPAGTYTIIVSNSQKRIIGNFVKLK